MHDVKGLPSVDEEVWRIVRVAHDIDGEDFEDIQEEEMKELESHQEEFVYGRTRMLD